MPRRSITFIAISFPTPFSQVAIRYPRLEQTLAIGNHVYLYDEPKEDTSSVAEYHILPAEQPLHPFPLVDFICQVPPIEVSYNCRAHLMLRHSTQHLVSS